MRMTKGFTLIELLVVIAIIALLLSILSPSLTRVKLQARRTMCRSNLHQWALGVLSYAAANGDKLLCTFGYTDDEGKIDAVIPNEFWLDATNYIPDSYYDHPGQFSFELMAPYMPSSFNSYRLTTEDVISENLQVGDSKAQSLILKDIWTCPSYKRDEREVLDDTLWRIKDRGFLRLRYSYFARLDLWQKFPTHPKDFGGTTPGSRHLLMADAIYYWIDEGLDYNHSVQGAKQELFEILVPGDEPNIAGINKIYGDGHAEWKDRRKFQGPDADPTLVDISDFTGRRVRGQLSGWGTGAANYY